MIEPNKVEAKAKPRSKQEKDLSFITSESKQRGRRGRLVARRYGDARCRGAEPPKQQRGDAGNVSVRTGRSACLRVSGESRAAARGESGSERSRVAEAPACASVRGYPTTTD